MAECEIKKQLIVDGKATWKWIRVKVSSIVDTPVKSVRCAYCHGAVKVHAKRVEHGPMDHVEHKDRQDSSGCPKGMYFDGNPRMSATPVE